MKKPRVNLLSVDDHFFLVMASASLALKKENRRELAEKMRQRVHLSKDTDEALSIIKEYVDIV
ncbi:hypothetical protein [Bacillus sp. 1P06AnD]|uniref:hypothetical protein n=1 Tax=Bacillus sp. 1P06AnD TaxID=3132208 RepID=UPI0039A26DBB